MMHNNSEQPTPFQEFLTQMMLNNFDLSERKVKEHIGENFEYLLSEYYGVDEKAFNIFGF
jgi:hypothetical protein